MSADVGNWLEKNGLGKYRDAFVENSIDWSLLAELTAEDLKELGLNIGERRRFLNAASSLGSVLETPDVPPAPIESPAREQPHDVAAERRQLTVMFCDLVGSTDLSQQLDPEDLREVMRAYQQLAEQIVRRYDGHVAQFLGDGVLVYFGYPIAHEDDAQRAVHSGIEIPRAIDELNTRLAARYAIQLAVRIGIHTGPVVVGEIGADDHHGNLAMGETPNRAAKLQELAAPGSVVVSESTRRLVGEQFELSALPEESVKGLSSPVRAYSVTRQRRTETRFNATAGETITAMVGRQQELALLLERWRQSKAGEGQVVALTGEAGIGKSRIMSALVEAVGSDEHMRISYQCSPYHTDSALYPAIQHLGFVAGISGEESAEEKLDKLEKRLRQGLVDIDIAAPLLGSLLGLDAAVETRYGPLPYSPQERREQTLQILLDQLIGLSRKSPILFVLEDAHWIDPTTAEMIERSLDRIGDCRILVLITARPVFDPSFGNHPIVTRLALNRLGRQQIVGIVEHLTKGKELPTELLDEIATKTDGVPLFVEEFTKTLLESGQLAESDDGFEYDGQLARLTIPSSLQDSLMARLDRMQPVKQVAQTAACIGREFSYSLLASVSPLSADELISALGQLVDAQLIFARGAPPDASYTYKHALVRDAAYESLLKTRRQAIHEKILVQLQADTESPFNLLAHHATEAGQTLQAVGYWDQAADQAFDRPAFSEAIGNIERAIRCLRQLPKSPDNLKRQLDLRVKLGHAATARFGYAHPSTAAAYAGARAMLEEVEDTHHRFPVLYGNYAVQYVRGNHIEALANAKAMRDEAERSGERIQKLIGYRVLGVSQVAMADFQAGDTTLQHALTYFDPEKDARIAWQYGTDIVDTLKLWWSLSLLCRGEGQAAWERVADIEQTARQRGHANAYAYALYMLALLAQLGRHADSERIGQLLTEVTDSGGLRAWEGMSNCHAGALHFERKEYAESVARMGAGLDEFQSTTAVLFIPQYLAMHSAGLAALGRVEDAASKEAAVMNMVDNGSEHWPSAEVLRILGEARYWQLGDASKAESRLRRAMAVAGDQGAKLWELRAALSLAEVLADRNERAQASSTLLPVLEHFPAGGAELDDFARAQQLLTQLD